MGVGDEGGSGGLVGGPEGVGQEDFDGLAEEFVAGVAEEGFGTFIDEDHVAVLIDDDHGVGGGFEEFSESFLEFFAVGDIFDQAIVAVDFAGGLAMDDGGVANPADGAVAMLDAMFDGGRVFALEDTGNVVLDDFAVVGVDDFDPEVGFFGEVVGGEAGGGEATFAVDGAGGSAVFET